MHHRFKDWVQGLSKKQRIALGVGVFLFIIAGSASALMLTKDDAQLASNNSTQGSSAGTPVPTTVPSLLTGLPVEPSVNKKQVTGVMIENSTDARPQSGLDQAGVVFEAIAEGGITRFLALFQDTESESIGPVRSVRPYYLQWCQSFDCAIAHVGGSPEALANIKQWGMKDLDQFAGGSYFDRSSKRPAPHNVYTSSAKLRAYESKKGYSSSSYTGIARNKTEVAAAASSPVVKSININYPGTAFDVHYDYDTATKSYKRSEAGVAHNVLNAAGTPTQLSPKVVVALVVSRSVQADNKHSTYAVVGSGGATIFQNGTSIHGTWTKASDKDQLTFLDDSGTTVKLNPGQTWISASDSSKDITSN